MLRFIQPFRDAFAVLSIISLIIGGGIAYYNSNHWFLLVLECSLVFAILSESYANDVKVHRYKKVDKIED